MNEVFFTALVSAEMELSPYNRCSTAFCLSHENSADTTLLLWLLQSSTHKAKAISAPCVALPAWGWGSKEL